MLMKGKVGNENTQLMLGYYLIYLLEQVNQMLMGSTH